MSMPHMVSIQKHCLIKRNHQHVHIISWRILYYKIEYYKQVKLAMLNVIIQFVYIVKTV